MSEVKVQQVETDPVANLQSWWLKNQKTLIIAVAVVVIAVGGWYAYKKFVSGPQEDKANLAIYGAEKYFRQDSFALALNGDGPHKGLLYVINNYGSTKAGNLAKYYAGISYLKTGDFNKAVKYLGEFSTEAKQIQMMAYGALGDAYSELNKNEDAITNYKKAAETFDTDELNASEYLFRAGLLSETAGKTKDAVDIYKQLKDKFPNTIRGREAEKYLNRLSVE
jgi:tetratricopeptide (TPR) repeat protein